MMDIKEPICGFESELRISSYPVVALLLLLGPVLYLAAVMLSLPWETAARIMSLSVLLQVLGAVSWMFLAWKVPVGRWVTIGSLVAASCLAGVWLPADGALTLLVLPVIVAAFSIGVGAAAITTLGVSLILVALLATGVALMSVGIAGIGIWLTLGMLYAANCAVHQVAQWAWEYLQRAQRLLQATRDRQLELNQALDDLMQANQQLKLSHERATALRLIAEEAQRSKSDFAARVSHEFRAPLNIVIGLVSLMVETPDLYAEDLPPDLWQDLEIVYRNCRHLSSMVDDVLDLSQVEGGQLRLHREQIDLAEVIESATTVVRPLLEKKRLAFEVRLPPDLPRVNCDLTRIRQVILNLVSNAARFTEQGGITISAERKDHHITVGVADTGRGIPPEEAERVFEPFYQVASRPAHTGEGSGLGLSICKQLIDLHGGRIWFESRLGVGTTFFFQLPMSPPAEHISGPERWLVEGWEWHERLPRRQRASLVGQPTRPRIVICDRTGGLESQAKRFSDQVDVVSVSDLSVAAQSLQQCPAHVLLLNAAATGDLFPWVESAREAIPSTPIVACTVPNPDEQMRCSGALDYLTKPVTCQDLEAAIRALGRPVQRVLLVDDDADTLRLWTRMLHAYDTAIEIVAVLDGQQALGELHTWLPDLALLDVILPDMSGWQLLERMGQDERLKDVPVFLVSAQDLTSQPLGSRLFAATIGEGLSIRELLCFSLDFSSLMFDPVREPGQVRG